jgi:hypothetical protein
MSSRTWIQRNNPAREPPPGNGKKLPERQKRKTQPLPISGYSAKEIEDFYDRRPFQVGWRLNSLGFPLLGK